MPLIRIRDIGNTKTEAYYDGDYREEFIVDPGTLLIGMDGNFNIRRWQGPRALLNQRVCRLWRFRESTEPDFVLLSLQQYLDVIHKESKNYTTVKHLSSKQIKAIPLPLPPLAEQHRIVEKVDSLMKLCDELEEKQGEQKKVRVALNKAALDSMLKAKSAPSFNRAWHRIRDNFDLLYDRPETVAELRQSILQLAVQGKLVPQDPNDEPASVLLERIRAEKEQLIKDGQIKKQKPLPPIDPSEVPFDLPRGWEWVRMIESFDVRDGTHDTPKYVTEGYPLVTSKNLYTGYLDLSNVKYISEQDHLKIAERSFVEKGDVLFAMIGSIGNPVIVDTEPNFSIKNVALFKYYNRRYSVPKYLRVYLASCAEKMRTASAGGVQSFVSLTFLRKYPFPLPPLREQHRIVEKVDSLMNLCDELEMKLRQSQTDSETLLTAMINSILEH